MRKITHRRPRYNKTMTDLGEWLLTIAEEIRKRTVLLDTSVRDNVAQGLAHIVEAGNDCTASNLHLTTDQWMSFIDNSTADWFRQRGYAEWFCIAAANGFRRSRPRILDEIQAHIVKRRKPRNSIRAAK